MASEELHMYFDNVARSAIPIFQGKGATNNRTILRCIALNQPMLKYGIAKMLKIGRYSTISRRVDDLVDREYIAEAGQRITRRGKQSKETVYGLTWRGFIASLTINEVRANIVQVLRNHPLLSIPEKDAVLLLLEEFTTRHELGVIAKALLEPLLEITPNLEMIRNEPMSLLGWIISINKPPRLPPSGFKLSKIPKDPWTVLQLIDKPAILSAVKNSIIPLVKQKTKEIAAINRVMIVLNEFSDFISDLKIEDQPSLRIKDYLETKLDPQLDAISDSLGEDN
jgi:hypothetical protein